MVCTEQMYEEDIEELDIQIKAFANRRNAFSRQTDQRTVSSTDTAMTSIVEREVARINAEADRLVKELDDLEKGVIAHKKEHMLSWAKRGLPDTDDDDDFRGVRLGEAMENVIKTRRAAIDAAKGAQFSKIPIIITEPETVEDVVTDDELLKLALEARKKR